MTSVDDLADVRAGDKGDTLILGVIARSTQGYERLSDALTADAVAKRFGLAPGAVARVALPQLRSLSFTLRGALGGGVTGSTNLDGHGKTMSYHLLGLEL